MTTTPAVWRPSFKDNQNDPGQQFNGVVAATLDNTFFGVWNDFATFNGGRPTIVGRAFDALGNPTGGDIAINPLTDAFGFPFFADTAPAVARLPIAGQADGLAVAFANDFNNGATDFDLYVVRTNSSLTRLEPFILIDGSVAVTNDPSITTFSNGSLVVAYTIQNTATDWDILARTVSAAGVLGPVITIFNDTDKSDHVDLATLANGNFVAVYDSQFFGTTDIDSFFQIRNSAGASIVGSTIVPGAFDGSNQEHDPHVAALTDGGFVVTWDDSNGDPNGTAGIRASVFDANGNLIQANILVNVFSQNGLQIRNDVTALPDGGFAVTWEDLNTNTDTIQRFDAAGNPVGAPVFVSTQATFDITAATYSDGRPSPRSMTSSPYRATTTWCRQSGTPATPTPTR